MSLGRILLFLSGLLLLTVSLPSMAAVTVAAFGDSITRGWPYDQDDANGRPYNGGYVPEVQNRLSSESGWDVTVLNYGHPGERVVWEGYLRFEPSYAYPVLSSNPDYVLVMEGTNDLSYSIGPGAISDKLEFIVDKVLDDGRVPLIGTLLPRFGEHGDVDVSGLNTLIRAMAVEKGIVLADLYAAAGQAWQYYMQDDGLHPNLAGYSLMAKSWSGALVQAKAIQDEIQRQRQLELERQRAAAESAAVSLLLLD